MSTNYSISKALLPSLDQMQFRNEFHGQGAIVWHVARLDANEFA
ncbi:MULTISPECIES: hypothetical protein [Bradyrhizobium]|jgi:hypothetical protein|nr:MULTISPECIES: hypothetical protein [Bradyrhizobium]MCS3451213.1 hypothetical protein [Bradyrhizobium elkanii]MCS3566764.1 hypothetical protein [Bradyrhizobium elkanii]MCW2357611.1 hypothetical protein [Bradyrhizobium elkanii]MCW2376242.1 hypothetical protein [Bradyrhizobium elkanii]MDI2054767.1 hypothetical protein [Bradyrhizobium sp. Mp19]